MLPHAASPRRALFGAGAAFLLATLTGFAHAAEKSPADTTKPVMFLRETVVTGSRYPRQFFESPQAISFLNRRQVREALPIVTSDVLAQVPGVDNSKDSPWEQRPVIRGLSGQRVLVLMDGSPMNSARGNGPHPSLVDPSQVERVEVVRGPSSVAYGSDAIGGVINIITREAAAATGDRGMKGGITVGGSSAEKMRTVVGDLSPHIGRLSAFVSGGGTKTDDYRSPDRTVENSAFSSYNWLANGRYDLTDHLALKAGWQQYRANDAGIPGLTTDFPGYHQDFDFSFYNRDYAHVGIEHAYPSSWLQSTLLQFYWQREFRDFFSHELLDASNFTVFGVPPAGTPGGPPAGTQTRQTNQDRYFDLNTGGFRLQMTSARLRRARFTAGVDGAQDRTDGNNVRFRSNLDASGATLSRSVLTTASVPDGRFGNLGGFVQGEWYATPKATVSGGARFTHYRDRTEAGISQPGAPFTARSVDDDALSGSLGIAYEVMPEMHLTANVANGYREPNAQDLFFNGPASVGFVQGDPNLEPERSLSYDLGLRWGPGPFAFSGNLFYSTYDNFIDAIPTGTQVNFQPVYQYTNISSATIWGGDLEAEARWKDRWTFRTQMSGQIGDATDRVGIQKVFGVDADRVPLPLIPPFKGSTAVRWTDAAHRFWVEPGARWAWRTNRLPPSQGVAQLTAFKKEYIVGDLMAGASLGSQRLTVGIRNFTDRAYQPALASVEEPGISFVGSLSTSF